MPKPNVHICLVPSSNSIHLLKKFLASNDLIWNIEQCASY